MSRPGKPCTVIHRANEWGIDVVQGSDSVGNCNGINVKGNPAAVYLSGNVALHGPDQWLAARARREGGCRAYWFDIHAYAAYEVALALEPSHEAARHLARQLLEAQSPDGVVPVPGKESAAAATGMALGLLTQD